MSKNTNWFCLIDGNEIGPVDSKQLKNLVIAGTLSLTDKIRKEDSEWNEISKFPKLVELVKTDKATSDDDGNEISGEQVVDKVKPEYVEAEWVPEWIVSYTDYLRDGLLVVVAIIVILARENKPNEISELFSWLIVGIVAAGCRNARRSVMESQKKLFSGDKQSFLAMNILTVFFGLISAGIGVAIAVNSAKKLPDYISLPLGILVFVAAIAIFAPWGNFAFKYRKHFKWRELDAEAKKNAVEGKFAGMICLAFLGFLFFGVGGLVAYAEGQILIGVVVHLAWFVIFGPWIYRTVKNRKKSERKVLSAEEKRLAAEKKSRETLFLAITCFLLFGFAGVIFYLTGNTLIGVAVHLGWVVIFGPWIYFTYKYGTHFEWKRDVFGISDSE